MKDSMIVFIALGVFIAAMFIVNMVQKGNVQTNTPEQVSEHIQAVGKVNINASAPAAEAMPAVEVAPAAATTPATEVAPVVAADPTAVVATASAGNGESTYKTVCMVCHAAGVANAPKLGDKAAWEPRIAKGMDALKHSVIHGLNNVMPPKGGRADISDEDALAAMDYMLATVQ